jgi:cell division protein FtsW
MKKEEGDLRKLSKIFNSDSEKSFDWGIIAATVCLLAVGVLMVYSSSSASALSTYGDMGYYLKRHAVFLIIGLGLMLIIMNLNYRIYSKFVYPAYILGLIALVAVLIPGVGKEVGGAKRWIDLGFMGFQPSEFSKFMLVLYLAHSLTKKREKMDDFSIGFVSHMLMGGAYILLMLLEPDFGMATITLLVLFAMLFVGGINLKYIAVSLLICSVFLVWGVMSEGYRMMRVISFLNPWKDPLGSGYQAVQSFIAFGLGGIYGTGLGNSTQKLFFLPEAHTDFIFSILGEELGFVSVFTIVALYGFLLWRGMRTALRAADLFGCYLAFGCILIITLQAATNMAVAVGLFPTKGLTLPLISYGGTSLVSTLMAIGVVLSVSKGEAR